MFTLSFEGAVPPCVLPTAIRLLVSFRPEQPRFLLRAALLHAGLRSGGIEAGLKR